MKWISLLTIILILLLISIGQTPENNQKEETNPFPITTGNFLLTLNKFIDVIKDFLSNLVEKIVDYA